MSSGPDTFARVKELQVYHEIFHVTGQEDRGSPLALQRR